MVLKRERAAPAFSALLSKKMKKTMKKQQNEQQQTDVSTQIKTRTELQYCELIEEVSIGYVRSLRQSELAASLRSPSKPVIRLTEGRRTELLDWLMAVAASCQLHRETFHLSRIYCDQFFASPSLSSYDSWCQSDLKLVAVSALLLASKMEEVEPMQAEDCVKELNYLFSIADVLAMEHTLLNTMDWKLSVATPFTWATWIVGCFDATRYNKFHRQIQGDQMYQNFRQRSFSSFQEDTSHQALLERVMGLIDVSVLDMEGTNYFPSILSISAVLLCLDSQLLDMEDCLDFIMDEYFGGQFQVIEKCKQWLASFLPFLPIKDYEEDGEEFFLCQSYIPYLTSQIFRILPSHPDLKIEKPSLLLKSISNTLPPPQTLNETSDEEESDTNFAPEDYFFIDSEENYTSHDGSSSTSSSSCSVHSSDDESYWNEN